MEPVDGTNSQPAPTPLKTMFWAAMVAAVVAARMANVDIRIPPAFWWTALEWAAWPVGAVAAVAAGWLSWLALRAAYRWSVAIGFTVPLIVIVILLLLILLKI